MNCKNCENSLRTDYSFCPDCGAKVIRNRITVKNLWYDAVERFFNVDNTFIVTFKHLFTKPEKVIVGYIEGVRKKYLNPISYFTIAVTIGGLFLFLNKQYFPEAMNYGFNSIDMETLSEADKVGQNLGKEFQKYLADYQNLFYVLMLPFLALISRVVFYNKKEYNLSEHFVMNIYGYSQMSLCVNLVYIALIWNDKLLYYASGINGIFQIAYFTYLFKRVFKLNIKQTILKLLLFLVVLGFVLFIFIVIGTIYLVVFTDTFQQMAPK
ncbi:DUF3667 domain-containing protein [Croceitalea vernalis]|uniref:DUF3667 domain-containing protein n=1 Tax=Croceitalea vernalis TaxID=3075599 RepID=A0ABU3BJA2_9FLAO|nr:DUF3667 domain-containing protein [Croceitalea sp. P007]MDT0622249.1 DUF3667 domain-containing protein [Croceitalea sp. P007]